MLVYVSPLCAWTACPGYLGLKKYLNNCLAFYGASMSFPYMRGFRVPYLLGFRNYLNNSLAYCCMSFMRKMMLHSCDCHPRSARSTNLTVVLEATLSHHIISLSGCDKVYFINNTFGNLKNSKLKIFWGAVQ